jgi:hypothetical protein
VQAVTGAQQLQQAGGGEQALSRNSPDLQSSVLAAKLSAFDQMAAAGLNTTAAQLLALALAGHNASSGSTTADALHALQLLQLLQRSLTIDTAAEPGASGGCALPAAAANLTAGAAGVLQPAAAECPGNTTLTGSSSSSSSSRRLEGINATLEQLISGCLGRLDRSSRALYSLLTDQPMSAAQLQAAEQALAARTAAGRQALAAQLAAQARPAPSGVPGSLLARLAAAAAAAQGQQGGGGVDGLLEEDVLGALVERLLLARFATYPSRSGCCKPGSGAFEQGCSLPAA